MVNDFLSVHAQAKLSKDDSPAGAQLMEPWSEFTAHIKCGAKTILLMALFDTTPFDDAAKELAARHTTSSSASSSMQHACFSAPPVCHIDPDTDLHGEERNDKEEEEEEEAEHTEVAATTAVATAEATTAAPHDIVRALISRSTEK